MGHGGFKAYPIPHALFQKSPCQLFKPLISIPHRLLADCLHVDPQRRVSPVKPRRLLGITSDTLARRLQQRSRRGGVVAGIVARRQVELAARSTRIVSIIIHESPGHWTERRQEIGGRK